MLQLQTLGSIDLRRADGAPIEAVLAGPKRLALLTWLVLARPRGFHRRDVLLALLWPDLDQERGRSALRTTLYHLRQSLGPDVIVTRGDDEVAIDTAALQCDAVEFERLLADGGADEALERYRGPLLRGLFLSGAPEWEQWLENERARLAARASAAAWSLAEDAAAAANAEKANRLATRAFAMQPDDEGALRRYITVLDRIGDRTGAVQAYDAFARMLQSEYDAEPAPETQQLIASVRERPFEPLPRTIPAPQSHSSHSSHPSPRRRATLAVLAIAALVLGGYAVTHSRERAAPVLAVGTIELMGVPDSLSGLNMLLATNLARVPGISVVSETRLAEVRARFDDDDAPFTRAARASGATEIIEGALAHRSTGGYRLDLRRIDVRTGATRGAFSIESTELFDVLDLATEWVAGEYGAQVPSTRYAATLSSLTAYRLYEQGLTAYYRNDKATAARRFRTALEEDSTFAMAALYLSKVVEEREMWSLLQRAERLSRNSFDRERLIIRAEWLFHMQDPGRLAIAETLLVRYPNEPQSYLRYGHALIGAGAFLEAIPHLRHLEKMDSSSTAKSGVICWSCEANDRLAAAYALLDSFPAVERLAREQIGRDPTNPWGWRQLSLALRMREAFTAAIEAAREDARLSGEPPTHFREADLYVRAQKFSELDSISHARLPTANLPERREIYWDQVIQFRTQGRFREALATADAFRATMPADFQLTEATPRATVLMDMGRYAEAAALYDSIAAVHHSPHESRHARHQTWTLAHAAGAYSALGDTARLREIEDTIRIVGARSAYARDQLLHHYVRGLRLMHANRHADAVNAFERSIYSKTSGYSRINLELARAYLATQQPERAVAILEAALRGPTGATGMYVTRTELQEMLGRAFEADGDRDRAARQYRRVVYAWGGSDSVLAARMAAVRQRFERVNQ